MSIVIEFAGEPIGKGRPRVRLVRSSLRTAFPRLYSPQKTVDYQTALGLAAKVAMKGRKPLTGSVILLIRAWFSVPKSWPTKKRNLALRGFVSHTSKPDLDNIQKITLDSLNGIVWKDDSQVFGIIAIKGYRDIPALRIVVSETEASPFVAGVAGIARALTPTETVA